jgi:hypothetical protein
MTVDGRNGVGVIVGFQMSGSSAWRKCGWFEINEIENRRLRVTLRVLALR